MTQPEPSSREDITGRKLEVRALRESEETFAKVFRCSPQPFTLSTIAEDRLLEVNEAFETTTGYRREEVLGRTTKELGIWENHSEREQLLKRAIHGEKIRNIECRFRKKNGDLLVGLLSAELVGEIAGETSVVSNIIDITQWRRTQEALRASERKAALYFQQTMFAVIEWDSNFRVVEWNPAAESIFGYTREEAISRHPSELIVPADIRSKVEGIFQALMSRGGGQLSISDNLRKNGERIVCEWFNTPLLAEDGSVLGVISLVHDITAQKQTQTELATSQATLSAVVESTDDLIWVVDPERFGLTMFNSNLSRYFTHQRGIELSVGMTPEELLPTPSWQELWKSFYRRALSQGSFQQEYEVVSGNRILDLSFHTLVREGEVLGISVSGKDVTEKRHTERALKESESRYRSLVESSHDWVWQVDADARYSYVGPQCRTILGYEPEEILGKTPFDLMPKAEAMRVAAEFGPIAAAHKPFRGLENVNLTRKGGIVILETNGMPVFDPDGNFAGYRGMDRDITERKRAEVALRESEERFRRVVEHIGDALFVDDINGHVVFANDRFLELFGFNREELPNITLEDYVAPEYRTLLRDRHNRRIRGEVMPTHFEYQACRRDGTRMWVEVEVVSVEGKDGEVIGTQSALRDITERKRAEEALAGMSRRLIQAQEQERTRIARDLHDDIAQRLALLANQADIVRKKVRSSELRTSIGEMQEELIGVVTVVQNLSHELHSSKLEYFGLVPAARSFCKEFGEAEKVDIEFKSEGIADCLALDVSLSMFRVLQEALRNGVKHSGARRFQVQLSTDARELHLTIRDSGVGFDVGAAMKGAGLGLVSMQERLKLINGDLSISSLPQRGTVIHARAPLISSHDLGRAVG